MPTPRTGSDLEIPLAERQRGLRINRTRRGQGVATQRLTNAEGANRGGTFLRPRPAAAPRGRAGGGFVRALNPSNPRTSRTTGR